MGKKTVNQIRCKMGLSLNFFDFEVFPDPIGLDPNIKIVRFKKGELRKNRRTIQKCNSIYYEKEYDDSVALNDAISDFIESFVELYFPRNRIDAIKAKQSFIRLKIPTYSSKNIQDGLVPIDAMKKMVELKLELDLIFT